MHFGASWLKSGVPANRAGKLFAPKAVQTMWWDIRPKNNHLSGYTPSQRIKALQEDTDE